MGLTLNLEFPGDEDCCCEDREAVFLGSSGGRVRLLIADAIP